MWSFEERFEMNIKRILLGLLLIASCVLSYNQYIHAVQKVYYQPFDNNGHLNILALLAFSERDPKFMIHQGKVAAEHVTECGNCRSDLKAIADPKEKN